MKGKPQPNHVKKEMRRYNLSLQRPQEQLRQRAIELERMRKEKESEETRRE